MFNEPTDEDGATVFRHACKLGLEGIVSKRLRRPTGPGPRGTGSRSKIRSARRCVECAPGHGERLGPLLAPLAEPQPGECGQHRRRGQGLFGTTCRNPAKLLAALMPSVGRAVLTVTDICFAVAISARNPWVGQRVIFVADQSALFQFIPQARIQDRTDRG